MQVTRVVKFIRKGEKGDKGDPGKDGVNYLMPVWWDEDVVFAKTPYGVPTVKVEDGSTLGFSVYALMTDTSTAGLSPAASPEWGLLESSEYMFILDAYIERLQAELVTAEKIEALTIKTENLEVLDGSKLGSLFVSGGKITSHYSRNETVWDYRTYPPTQVGSIPVSGSLEVSVDRVQITKNHFVTFNTTTIEGDQVLIEKDSINYKSTVRVASGSISIVDTPKDSGSERRVDITSEGIYINGVKRL